jgi:hypothetical protein
LIPILAAKSGDWTLILSDGRSLTITLNWDGSIKALSGFREKPAVAKPE